MSTSIENLVAKETIFQKVRYLKIKIPEELLALYTAQRDDLEPFAGVLDMNTDQLGKSIEKVKEFLTESVLIQLQNRGVSRRTSQ